MLPAYLVSNVCGVTILVVQFQLPPRPPNLVHKNTKDSLWADRLHTPQWVPDALQRKAAYKKVGSRSFQSVSATYAESQTGRTVNFRSVQQNVVSWTTRILQQIKCGQSKQALRIFEEMQERGLKPSTYTFVAALKACSKLKDLDRAKQIHAQLVGYGLETDVYVGTMLVDVYIKCGSLPNASSVFFNMPHRDVVSWTAMILGYARMEKGEVALELFRRMQHEGVLPNDRTFVSVLKACSSLAAVEEAKEVDGILVKQRCLEKVRDIHSEIKDIGCELDVYVSTMLVDVYVKCRSIVDARHVFEKMPRRDVISWTAMVLGFVHMGEGEAALQLYAQMQQEGVAPDCRAILGALQACSTLTAREVGTVVHGTLVKKQCLDHVKAVHSDAVKGGFESDVFVGGLLVDVYVKCGSLGDARRVFDNLHFHDLNAWNAMIWGYAQIEEGEIALKFYSRMQQECVAPNDRTFVGALKASSSFAELEGVKGDGTSVKKRCLNQVRAIHLYAVKSGCDSDVFVATMLVDVYAKCGSLSDARRVFDEMPLRDVVSWNAMIFAYTQIEDGEEALRLFAQMQQEAVVPDDQTFVSALKACSCLVSLKEGYKRDENGVRKRLLDQVKAIHSHVVDRRSQLDVFLATMLVDSYAKCGSLVDARHVFDNMPHRDVVSWTAMILAYAHMEEGDKALDLYREMEQEGVVPNDRTYVGVLKACGSVAGLEKGKAIHAEICRTEPQTTDSFVASSLIDMYVNCGSMVDAQQVFEALVTKDVVTWNALITGYARHGETAVVFHLFESMMREGIQPVAITFLSVLTACSHVGSVDKGQRFYDSMNEDFGITPSVQHSTCLVDLLGRAGQVCKAMSIARTFPTDAVVWKTVLGACQKWGKVDLGREAFDCAVRLDHDDAAAYVLMSNIYVAANMWEEADMIQAMKAKTRAWKQPGQSWWTDSGGIVHTFMVSDQEHSESRHILAQLENLISKLKEEES